MKKNITKNSFSQHQKCFYLAIFWNQDPDQDPLKWEVGSGSNNNH